MGMRAMGMHEGQVDGHGGWQWGNGQWVSCAQGVRKGGGGFVGLVGYRICAWMGEFGTLRNALDELWTAMQGVGSEMEGDGYEQVQPCMGLWVSQVW